MASDPRVMIITGYGLNCEAESCRAWERAGAQPERVHLHDLLENPRRLHDVQALMFIGGFSFGDHMGSGHVFASRLRHRMADDLRRFVEDGKLVLGICNGFQVLVKLGLLPGLDGEFLSPKLALIQNDCGSFQDRWVHVRFEPASACPFTGDLGVMAIPVRHGEGRLFTQDKDLLARLETEGCVACRYVDPGTGEPASAFPHNPNGSLNAIAGLCDPSGRVLGMMPHPEAFLFRENHPTWDRDRPGKGGSQAGDGLRLFTNAVACLRQ